MRKLCTSAVQCINSSSQLPAIASLWKCVRENLHNAIMSQGGVNFTKGCSKSHDVSIQHLTSFKKSSSRYSLYEFIWNSMRSNSKEYRSKLGFKFHSKLKRITYFLSFWCYDVIFYRSCFKRNFWLVLFPNYWQRTGKSPRATGKCTQFEGCSW